ncbi:unnamed protein product, partial [Meganyctiphanes norvegica]
MQVLQNKVNRFTQNNVHLLVSDIQEGKKNNAQAEVYFYVILVHHCIKPPTLFLCNIYTEPSKQPFRLPTIIPNSGRRTGTVSPRPRDSSILYQPNLKDLMEFEKKFLTSIIIIKKGLTMKQMLQKVLRASSPRPPETEESDSFSPKRPRLSIDVQQSSQEPHTPNDDSRLSADSDSEMIPVKQEMVELKECSESLYEGDADAFIPEAYLRDGNNSNSALNNQSSSSSSHPNAPPPPGPLQPSYVPPLQVKTQDDSPLSLQPPPDELSQGFDILRAYEYTSGNHGEMDLIGNIKSTYIEASPFGGVSNALPWRRPLSGTDGYVSCPQCHKPITSYNLNRHIRMVHSKMEHAVCTICNKEFKNKYSLATHIHRQHSDPSIFDHRQEVNSISDVNQPVCRSPHDTQPMRKGNVNDSFVPNEIKN